METSMENFYNSNNNIKNNNNNNNNTFIWRCFPVVQQHLTDVEKFAKY